MKKKELIKSYYAPKIFANTTDSAKLGWESDEAQKLRFSVLADNIDLDGKSLLDVGCGLGNLFGYLAERKINVKYSGVDLLEEMVACAKVKCPEAEFFCDDIFEGQFAESHKYDVIYSSGIFNLNLVNNFEFLEKALRMFISMARSAVVISLLSDRSDSKEPEYFYYNPKDISEIISKLLVKPRETIFIDSYLKNDFTVILLI